MLLRHVKPETEAPASPSPPQHTFLQVKTELTMLGLWGEARGRSNAGTGGPQRELSAESKGHEVSGGTPNKWVSSWGK